MKKVGCIIYDTLGKIFAQNENCPANHIFREKQYVFSKRIFLKNANIEGTSTVNPKRLFILELFTLVREHLMPNVSYMIHKYLHDL